MPRKAAPTLTPAMLPPNVREYVPDDLADRDLPLWYAAFETGRHAAHAATEAVTSRPRPKPERVRIDPQLPPPTELIPANYDDDDEDSTLDALLDYARQHRPQIDSAKLASAASQHDEMGKWLKNRSLPSGRLIDMMLDTLVETSGKSILKAA